MKWLKQRKERKEQEAQREKLMKAKRERRLNRRIQLGENSGWVALDFGKGYSQRFKTSLRANWQAHQQRREYIT